MTRGVFIYRKLYNCKYENEEIESVRITRKIIEIMESFNTGYGLEKGEYLKVLTIIDSLSTFENTDNWFKYVISNVYENIVNLPVTTHEDRLFIKYIENNGTSDIFNKKEAMMWILSKFYIYNSLEIDMQTLNELREKTPKIKIKYIQQNNPYYNEEKNNFHNLKEKEN